MTSPLQDRQHQHSLESTIAYLAALLEHGGGALTTGDVASLRRMDPRAPVAAFFKLAGIALGDALPNESASRLEAETRWAAIVAGLALLGDLHRSGRWLGTSLAEAEFSEFRFDRLLRADSERLIDDLPMLARYLVAKGIPVDWTQAAWLLLSAARSDEERARRRLARDYYAALARKSAT